MENTKQTLGKTSEVEADQETEQLRKANQLIRDFRDNKGIKYYDKNQKQAIDRILESVQSSIRFVIRNLEAKE